MPRPSAKGSPPAVSREFVKSRIKSFRRPQGRSIRARTSPLKGDRRPVFLPYTTLSFPPREGGRAFCARGLFLCRENSLERNFLSPRSAPLLFYPKRKISPFFFRSFSPLFKSTQPADARPRLSREAPRRNIAPQIFFKWKALLPFYITFYTVQKFCRTPLFVPRAAYTAASSLRTFPKEKRAIFP